ncbi:Membrane protein implicated in regulation of membrane protease activity [Halomicrobium zhouii]|uniref:Membrane protein implicated in regulation of membrane protease activity n=1 Tax=Halomicrobium zhouii TaxID=767519 RepID=A0A1I6LG88_9EURY|nr:NfeD family protein [Halomicrobium zhouii]SFS02258.1 Membrane protein implicated in regulation of membrane protease activity [Halomicrobium zhouii]
MPELFSESISFFLFLAGAILLVAEAFAPGAHLFVLGVALLSAGLVGLLLPGGLGIFAPIILAVVVLALTGLTLWGYRRLDIYGGEGAAETSHSGSLRGQFGTVTERVTTTEGEVKLEDGGFNPYYRARSVEGEIEVGSEVMVVDPGGGNVVTVESVAAGDDIDRALARERDASDSDGNVASEGDSAGDGTRETDVESDRAS